MRNYAIDPTTKEYVDKLNVFILPVVNPDGGARAVPREQRASART